MTAFTAFCLPAKRSGASEGYRRALTGVGAAITSLTLAIVGAGECGERLARPGFSQMHASSRGSKDDTLAVRQILRVA